VATVSAQRAHHLAETVGALPGFSVSRRTPFLWEFVLHCPGDAATVASVLRGQGIVAGLPLGRVDPRRNEQLLVCCTEMTPPAAIDRYAAALSALDGAALAPATREVAV
jgi:glycine dehydrogenase subunit 1